MAMKAGRFVLALGAAAMVLVPLAAEARPDRGWGGGWNGRGWHRDRGGIDGGDVLLGLLLIGGIAAIAASADNANRDRRRERDGDDGYRYRDEVPSRSDPRAGGWQPQARDDAARPALRDIDDAVDRCVAEASAKGEVADIYSAARSADGFRVSGALANGDGFSCDVSAQGGVLLDIRRR
ncbi:MAG: hypothetical protein ACK4G2_08765 [Novosphingobium sp.]